MISFKPPSLHSNNQSTSSSEHTKGYHTSWCSRNSNNDWWEWKTPYSVWYLWTCYYSQGNAQKHDIFSGHINKTSSLGKIWEKILIFNGVVLKLNAAIALVATVSLYYAVSPHKMLIQEWQALHQSLKFVVTFLKRKRLIKRFALAQMHCCIYNLGWEHVKLGPSVSLIFTPLDCKKTG